MPMSLPSTVLLLAVVPAPGDESRMPVDCVWLIQSDPPERPLYSCPLTML